MLVFSMHCFILTAFARCEVRALPQPPLTSQGWPRFWPDALAPLRGRNHSWTSSFFYEEKSPAPDLIHLTILLSVHRMWIILTKLTSMSLQLYREIEICPKPSKVIRFDKAESCTTGYGMVVSCDRPQLLIHWNYAWNWLFSMVIIKSIGVIRLHSLRSRAKPFYKQNTYI